MWVLPEGSSGFWKFTKGVLRFCDFYQMDPPVLEILPEGSSDFVGSTEGSSGFWNFTKGILRFRGFYRRDYLVLEIPEGSSGFGDFGGIVLRF